MDSISCFGDLSVQVLKERNIKKHKILFVTICVVVVGNLQEKFVQKSRSYGFAYCSVSFKENYQEFKKVIRALFDEYFACFSCSLLLLVCLVPSCMADWALENKP